MQDAGTYIETVPHEKIKKHLLGEFELIISFAKYNDLWAMAEHHAKAYKLLDGPASFYDHNLSSPSVLYLFYRQSGLLDQTAQDYAANNDAGAANPQAKPAVKTVGDYFRRKFI